MVLGLDPKPRTLGVGSELGGSFPSGPFQFDDPSAALGPRHILPGGRATLFSDL